MNELILYSDGASRGNPGRAGIGAVLYQVGEAGRLEEVGEVSRAIGRTTNNVAEYEAVIAGFEMAAQHRPDRLVLRSDSELLIRQLQGVYRVKAPNLKPLVARVRELAEFFPEVRYEHVRREANQVADALANQALDA